MSFSQKITNIICIIGIQTLLSGCAAKLENVIVSQDVLAKPSTLIIAQINGLEKAQYYKYGNQGLLDVLINEMMTNSVEQKIQEIDPKPIISENYYESFEKSFSNKSFQVKRVTDLLDIKKLVPMEDQVGKYAPYDFKPMKTKYGATYALVLQPSLFGVQRSYHGFLPTSAPSGLTELSIYLVSLQDNLIVGRYSTKVDMPVNGDWDTPPEFVSLTQASKDSLKKALNDAHSYFFATTNAPVKK